MSGLFEVLASEDHEGRIAKRKATAIANKRVTERFANFIAQATDSDERKNRIDLVRDDLVDLVTATCREYDVEPESITTAILAHLAAEPKDDDDDKDEDKDDDDEKWWEKGKDKKDEKKSRTASVHEARKPKVCPYHREVMDISLAQGEARAGFDAMAQHAFGPQHCKGFEYEGNNCNFKPDMTTQTFWDERAEKAQERREEREKALQEQQQQEAEAVQEQPVEELATEPTETVDEAPVEDNVVEVEFGATDGTSAVGEGVEAQPEQVAASVADRRPLAERTAVWPPLSESSPRHEPYSDNELDRGVDEQDSLRDEQTDPLVRAVKQHATEHYEEGGWDYIVEAYTDDEVAELIRGATTPEEAIAQAGEAVGVQGEVRDDVRGEAGGHEEVDYGNYYGPGQPATSKTADGGPSNGYISEPEEDGHECPECKGSGTDDCGSVPQSHKADCPKCHGEGKVSSKVADYSDFDDGADSGGWHADPYGGPGQAEYDDPNSPYYDQPCPQCHKREGAFEQGSCAACGYQDPTAQQPGPDLSDYNRHGPLSSTREAEALETVDVTKGGEDPFPKIDKREWTPENVKKRLDTEGEGSPHPTRERDILESIDYEDDDFLAETNAVTEKQDVDKDSGPKPGKQAWASREDDFLSDEEIQTAIARSR